MSAKKKLTEISKNRLAELIESYLNPAIYYIYNSGTVTLDETKWWKRMFNIRNENDVEFFPLVKELSARIIAAKGKELTFTGATCGRVAMVLLDTYDLDEVTRLLYLAHLVEDGDLVTQKTQQAISQGRTQYHQKPKVEVEVQVEKRAGKSGKNPLIFFNEQNQAYSSARRYVEDLFNNVDVVVVND